MDDGLVLIATGKHTVTVDPLNATINPNADSIIVHVSFQYPRSFLIQVSVNRRLQDLERRFEGIVLQEKFQPSSLKEGQIAVVSNGEHGCVFLFSSFISSRSSLLM